MCFGGSKAPKGSPKLATPPPVAETVPVTPLPDTSATDTGTTSTTSQAPARTTSADTGLAIPS